MTPAQSNPFRTDPIAALATPPGRSALGVVRISGEGCWDIAARATAAGADEPSPSQPAWQPREARVVTVHDASGHPIDKGVLLPWQGPASSTGEDMVEFIGHGSPEGLRLVLQRFLALGARPAEPGEFTRRGFLNGKLTLEKAEAVAAYIDARTSSAARAAMRVMGGTVTREIRALVLAISGQLGLIELDHDFSEEEIRAYDPATTLRTLEQTRARIAELRRRAETGRLLRQGIHVVLVGAANVGKSTLFNQLVGHDRAMVSRTPGTTRDFLDAEIPWGGLPVRLFDTAGFRFSADDLELEGIRRAREMVDRADVLLWLTAPPGWDLPPDSLRESTAHTLVVRNMVDLPDEPPATVSNVAAVRIRADIGHGVDTLRQLVVDTVLQGATLDDSLGLESRHLRLLDDADHALLRANSLIMAEDGEELLAVELRQALNALSTITGEGTGEDLLNQIFGRFCIGK